MRSGYEHKRRLIAAQSEGWVTLLESQWPAKLPRMAFAPPNVGPAGDTLLVVFLRGAADGLNIVVPHADDLYYAMRPTLAIPRPGDNRADPDERVLDVDGFFGLHPSMNPLLDAWNAGHLGLIHASGSPEDSHSHFRAMEYMERGVSQAIGPASGWLNRHLAMLDTQNTSPLRGLGWGGVVPRSLQGSVPVMALRSITEAHMGGEIGAAAAFRQSLRVLYRTDSDMHEMGLETLSVLDELERLDPNAYQQEGERRYLETEFSQGLKQIAMLIKSEVGLEVAAVDLGGWDTHFAQGGAEGHMANLLADLAGGLAAFHSDLGDRIEHVIVVVMTEFGRRVAENASLGTDHGHGGIMLLLGGGVVGHQVHSRWPGLHDGKLFGPGDLPVTTDYREVLSEIINLRLGNPGVSEVFPNFTPLQNGFVVPRS